MAPSTRRPLPGIAEVGIAPLVPARGHSGTWRHQQGHKGASCGEQGLRASEQGQREVGSVSPGPAGHPGRMWTPTLPLLQGTAASVAGVPWSSPGSAPTSWSPHGSMEREGRPCCPVTAPWSGAGSYLAKQLVHLHGPYLRAAGGAKNRGISLGQGGHPLLRFLGNAWLWHMSISAAAG